ncbi:unnamed protein product [Gongylonema pulchrum]|uniref:ZP domain-containing protein n=1 Tax=Gongylonema pulchrum TaxID=637853 RepID=A0A183EI86_9BILA|nr:unnamed protein product [Gongylonema pulchrum]
MEDRMKLSFRTALPFTGRVFVKGMVDKDQCVESFIGNTKTELQYVMNNGQCNMRRSRKHFTLNATHEIIVFRLFRWDTSLFTTPFVFKPTRFDCGSDIY